MGVRRSTGELVRRGLMGFLLLQVVAVASLMGADRIRRMVRGSNVEQLSPTVPRDCTLADGSELTAYTYGASLFEDMIKAIDAARERVLLESYIIKNDATGREFKQALIAAAERGVDVRVVYDGFANLVVRRSFFDFPPPVRVFRYPLWNGGWRLPSPRRLGRDHRKILVVDDTAAFVGGYNVGALYATEWRDTHVRVTGRSVWDLDNAFVDFWNANATVAKQPHGPLKSIGKSSWDTRIRAHRNVPRQLIYPIRAMYLEAIDRAHESIDITAAYFIPDRDILEGLLLAASRRREDGSPVRVRILTPKVSNHVVTDWLSRGFYGQLLRGGVEIHHYQGHMVHAKTATIDGQWSTIGTANIDRLSLQGNYEINLEILDAGFAAEMNNIFEDDLDKAEQLTLAEWNRRPSVAKLYESILRPLGPLL